MSQRQGRKRRISFAEGPDAKKADRKASPPRDEFQTASPDDTNKVDKMELNPRSSSRKSHVESGSESDNDNQDFKSGSFDDVDYHPGARVPTKPRLSRSQLENQAAKSLLTKAENTPKNKKALVEALEKLKCTEDDMKQIFESLRIPYCSDRRSKPNRDGYYTASNMPIRILKEFGWDFDDKSPSRITQGNMRSIYSTQAGKRIGMQQTLSFQQSGEEGEDPSVERTAKNLQGQVVENLNRMRYSMENERGVLAVPAEWGDEQYIGCYPRLPKRFLAFKRDKTPPRESKISQTPGSPASSTWESPDGTPIKQSLSLIAESPEEGRIPAGSELPAPASGGESVESSIV